MSLIVVDQEKCNRDGICAAVCPPQIIELRGEGFPESVAGTDTLCISCGHCVAVCQTGALSHARIPVVECVPIREELHASAEVIEQFLKKRRSIRTFEGKTVPRELLEHLIDTARWAHSAVNTQPVRWTIVYDGSRVKHLAGLLAEWVRKEGFAPHYVAAWDRGKDTMLRGAPHLVVATASAENPWAQVDSVIALTYLELAAQAHGLGTCWAGILTRAAAFNSAVTEYLKLEAGHKVCGAVMLGYPKYRYHRIPKRNTAVLKWL
jgi:nitroreductase/NAD-dependent dihydropyrimidine dehydrogenase PreA subunit